MEALKDALAALKCGASNFADADRRFVRAMIALGAPNNAIATAFGISEAELLTKFPGELESRASDLNLAKASVSLVRAPHPPLSSTFAYRDADGACRPLLHERHLSAASSFQIGVSRGRPCRPQRMAAHSYFLPWNSRWTRRSIAGILLARTRQTI